VYASADIDEYDDDEPGQFDELTEALAAAIAAFTGVVQAAAGLDWNPALHPRDRKGQFRTVFARVMNALQQWSRGEGGDHPLRGQGFTVANLRTVATKNLGLKVRRSSVKNPVTAEEIEDQILDYVRDVVKGKRGEDAEPKGHRRFTIDIDGKSTDVGLFRNERTGELVLYRESDAGRKQGQPIRVFDDSAELEAWARDEGHEDIAEYAAKAPVEPRRGPKLGKPSDSGPMPATGKPVFQTAGKKMGVRSPDLTGERGPRTAKQKAADAVAEGRVDSDTAKRLLKGETPAAIVDSRQPRSADAPEAGKAPRKAAPTAADSPPAKKATPRKATGAPAVAKMAGAKVPKEASESVATRLKAATTREEAHAMLEGYSADELKAIVKVTGTSLAGGGTSKAHIKTRIVEHTVGFRLNSQTIRDGSWGAEMDAQFGRTSSPAVAKKTGAAGEGAMIRELSAKNTSSAQLRKIAESLGIDFPPTLRAKTSWQLFLAQRHDHPGLAEAVAALPSAPPSFDPSPVAEEIVAPGMTAETIMASLGRYNLAQLRRVATALNLLVPTDIRSAAALRQYIAENIVRDRTRWSLR